MNTFYIKDTALKQVQTRMNNLVVLLGTNNVQINCSITLNTPIGQDISALQVSWRMNGTEQLSNTILTPRDNIEHTDSFTSTLTVINIDKIGNYCCIASLAGNVKSMSDCVIVTVSGTFNCILLHNY